MAVTEVLNGVQARLGIGEEERTMAIHENENGQRLASDVAPLGKKRLSGNWRVTIVIGTVAVPHSKDKRSPKERQEKRHLVRQGATFFKEEVVR